MVRTDHQSDHGRPNDADSLSYSPKDQSQTPQTVQEGLDQALAGGGGGAPTTASYVTIDPEGALSAERQLAAGPAGRVTDGGANNSVQVGPRSQIFITDVTGAGTITNKGYVADTVPSNKVLNAAESDNDDITIKVQVHVVGDTWPDAATNWVKATGAGIVIDNTVNASAWSELVSNARVFEAQVNATDADTTGTITVTTADGATATFSYTRALDPPDILTAAFDTHAGTTGGDPLVQGAQVATTSVQSTQTVRVTGTCDSHATRLWVTNAGVSSSEQGPYTISGGTFDITLDVRSSGGTGAQTATVECAVGVGGTRGSSLATSNTVTVDHTVPAIETFSQSDVTYPASQEALKDAETCSVALAHTNAAAGDTYLYDDNSTSELTIPSTTTYATPKTGIARAGGNYRESGTNYRLTATRTAQNGTSTTRSCTIKIAHAAPVVTVAKNSSGTALDRLRTDDGTNNYKDHTVYLNSSQANLSTHTPVLTLDAGHSPAPTGWQGSWSADGDTRYTRSLRIQDAAIVSGGQAANDYTWASCSVKNRANKEATVVTTNPNYSLGGFELRRLTIPAWPNREVDMSVVAVDTTKLEAELLSKGGDGPSGGTVQTFDNSPGSGTPDNEVDKFCISDGAENVDDDGQHYYNKDEAAAIANTSGTAQVDVEETA